MSKAEDQNTFACIGRVASDIELRYTGNGTAVANFRIAVNGRPGRNGEENVSFFPVVVWKKQAENCNKYLSKGQQVALTGRLEQQSWTDKHGNRRSKIEIIANRVQFLAEPKRDNQGGDITQGTGFNPEPVNAPEDDNAPF